MESSQRSDEYTVESMEQIWMFPATVYLKKRVILQWVEPQDTLNRSEQGEETIQQWSLLTSHNQAYTLSSA